MEPFTLVVVYLLLEFGRPQDLIPGLGVLHLPGLVTALLGLTLLGSRTVRLADRETKLFLLLLALMAFHVPIATNNYWALEITLTMLQTFVAYLAIITVVRSLESFERLMAFWLGIHVYLAIVGIVKQGRGVGGFLGDENDFAMTMNMVIPFAFFATFAETDRLKKLLYAGALALFVYANVVTLSRGGFVGLVAVALYCWLRSPRKLVSAALISGLVLMILWSAPAKYWTEIRSIQQGTADPTGKGRKYLWDVGWNMFLDNPLLGVGQGNFPFRFRGYEVASGFEKGLDGTSRAGRAAHSLYFTLLPELGLAGTLLWALLVAAVFKDTRLIRRSRRKVADRAGHVSLAIEASLVGFLVSGGFISVLYYPNFWILTAFAVALGTIATAQQAGRDRSRPGVIDARRLRPLQAGERCA